MTTKTNSQQVDDLEGLVAESDRATAALAALVAAHDGRAVQFRQAVEAADADRAVEIQRQIDEHPIRLRVAEVVAARAQLAAAVALVESEKAAQLAADPAWEEARAKLDAAVASGSRSAVIAAQSELTAASTVCQRHGAIALEASAKVRRLEDRLDWLVAPAQSDLAPVVRSIPHSARRG